MSGGQIAALILGIILLIPGGCILLAGTGVRGSGDAATVVVGLVILSVVVLLFWTAFRRREPPQPPGP